MSNHECLVIKSPALHCQNLSLGENLKINIFTLFVHVLWVIDGIMGQSYNICKMQCLIKYDIYLQVRSIIHKTYMEELKNTLVV